MINLKPIPLCKDSEILVYSPSIKFFIDKIETEDYFSFTRQLHGFWDSIIAAFILEPSLRYLSKDVNYLSQLADVMHLAKSATIPLRYDSQIFLNALKFIVRLDKQSENLFFGVSDVAFYPQKIAPYSINSYPTFLPTHHLLPTSDPLKCYLMRCGDKQAVMKYFLPDNYIPFNGVIWRQYSFYGDLVKLFNKCKNLSVVIVGPEYFQNFGEFMKLPNYHHYKIHETKASLHREELFSSLMDYHKNRLDNRPAVWFFVAGLLGNWLVEKLHNRLNKSFLIDVGLALDPLFPKEKVTKRTHYNFFQNCPNDPVEREKVFKSYENLFINEDLGYRMEITDNGKVVFKTREISRWRCFLKTLKTRIEYTLVYKLKIYRLKKYSFVNYLIKFYWDIRRSRNK